MCQGKRKALEKSTAIGEITDKLEEAKVRDRVPAKNMARLTTPFALRNLWVMRRQVVRLQG